MEKENGFKDMSVAGFIESLASGEPTPGGGSASAIAGSMGAGLVSMVANLTLGRKKYADVADTVEKMRSEAEALRRHLLALADADSDAYGKVMSAFKMSKDTPEQKELRSKAIQEGLKGAAEVPFKVAEAAVAVRRLAGEISAIGNPNAHSDAEVAQALAVAAFKGAAANVAINLDSIKDEGFVNVMKDRLEALRSGLE